MMKCAVFVEDLLLLFRYLHLFVVFFYNSGILGNLYSLNVSFLVNNLLFKTFVFFYFFIPLIISCRWGKFLIIDYRYEKKTLSSFCVIYFLNKQFLLCM